MTDSTTKLKPSERAMKCVVSIPTSSTYAQLAEHVDSHFPGYDELLAACEDGHSFVNGTFADALLALGDSLPTLDEAGIAVCKLWLLHKAEELRAAVTLAKGATNETH
jgi:hypothetical protein